MKCRLSNALGALALAALAACAQPLSLPAAPAPVEAAPVPEVRALSVQAGFADDVLVVTGRNFAPAAEDDEVLFAGARVRAFQATPTQLQVRVPRAAGDGTVAVATPAGQSTTPQGPAADALRFRYLGLGHLEGSGRLLSSVRLLHHPVGLAPVPGGDVHIVSQLFRAAIARSGRQIGFPSKLYASDSSPDGKYLAVGMIEEGVQLVDLVAGSVVALKDPAQTQVLGTAAPGQVVVRALTFADPAGGGPRFFAVGENDAGTLSAHALFGAPLERGLIRSLDGYAFRGAAATPAGRFLVVLADRSESGESGALVVDMQDESVPPAWFPLSGHAPGGAAVGLVLAGRQCVAAALDDGSVGILQVDGAGAGWRSSTLDTLSRGQTGEIALAPRGDAPPLLLVTKPLEGALVALDPATGPVWGVPLRGRPLHVKADRQAQRAYVGDDDSNFVDQVDYAQGRWVGRIAFDTGLGAEDAALGAAFDKAVTAPPAGKENSTGALDYLHPDRILVLSRQTRTLMPIEVEGLRVSKPRPLATKGADGTKVSAPRGLQTDPDGRVWVLHERELGTFNTGTAKKETIVVTGLSAPPSRLAWAPDGRLLVASSAGVDVYAPGPRDACCLVREGGSSFLGRGVRVEDVKFVSRSTALVLWSEQTNLGARGRAALWSVDQILHGQSASAHLDDTPGYVDCIGALALRAAPLFFFSRTADSTNQAAIWLDPSTLQPQAGAAPIKSEVDQRGPLGASPDGRYFLWTRQLAGDNVLRFVEAGAPQTPPQEQVMNEAAFLALPGEAGAAAFSPDGERLFVGVRGQDEIDVFE